MAKDKLITVRIEGEKREAFNEWAKSRNTDSSTLLYDFIDACLAHRIDPHLLKPTQLDTEQLDLLVTERIDAAMTEKIESAIASLRDELQPILDAHHEITGYEGKFAA